MGDYLTPALAQSTPMVKTTTLDPCISHESAKFTGEKLALSSFSNENETNPPCKKRKLRECHGSFSIIDHHLLQTLYSLTTLPSTASTTTKTKTKMAATRIAPTQNLLAGILSFLDSRDRFVTNKEMRKQDEKLIRRCDLAFPANDKNERGARDVVNVFMREVFMGKELLCDDALGSGYPPSQKFTMEYVSDEKDERDDEKKDENDENVSGLDAFFKDIRAHLESEQACLKKCNLPPHHEHRILLKRRVEMWCKLIGDVKSMSEEGDNK